ncbi:NAD+ synthase [Microbacteriaceae bacterium VKM Ac-2854]|nr:NAD+ synthase [Microbacteriaceae bacterium VKM Ac-2854]
MPTLRVALAQTDPVVGAFQANSDAIVSYVRAAHEAGADLCAFGEMALSGYPIEDLATRPAFLAESRAALHGLARRLDEEGLGEVPVVLGFPDGPFSPQVAGRTNAPTAIAQNCAGVLYRGELVGRYVKHHLPNYSVFDEFRVFIPGSELLLLRVRGADVAIVICEDLWRDGGPVAEVNGTGAGLLLVINASPFERDKDEVRLPLVTRRAVETGATVAYVNLVGGQDDLVFDGDSVIVDEQGRILARAPQFREHLLVADLEIASALDVAPEGGSVVQIPTPAPTPRGVVEPDIAVPPSELEQLWNALVLGLRGYVVKNGFPSVLLGLSGGIDSAVCAALSADAIGAENVFGVSMPSRYSSDHSRSDAEDLAERIGLRYRTEAIADLVLPFEKQLGLDALAAENLQARVRGVILMGLSNQEGHLVLTTGNKSELAVGYSTIYGDSVGGFAPLKDVPKLLVWQLARWRNAAATERGEVAPIPENSISKPPSAELRPGQEDQDTLPEYDVLDGILAAYVNRRMGRDEVIALGYDPETVLRITGLVDRAEWKRRQSAIGPKISEMAFGRDRRLPITNRSTS